MPFSCLFFRNRYIHLLLFSLLVALVFISASAASNCIRTCGTSKTLVPYPFGFSDGCKIILNCTNESAFVIGDHLVRNVTPDNIVVDLPAKCNRSIQTIKNLWSTNYAPTWKNGFLLRGCNSSDPNCFIPTHLLEQKLGLGNCSRKAENSSCFSKEGDGLMGYENLTGSGCRFLIASYAFDSSKNSLVSLNYQTVELDWWLEGRCSGAACAPNALCTEVKSTTSGATGYRCRCADGFEGDGFRDGDRCRKVSFKCNPSKYMTGHCGGNNRVGVLIGGIIAGASLMAGIAVLCYFVRQRSTSLRTRKSGRRLLSEATGTCTVPYFPYREIEKATNGFSEKNRLGTGAYGTVYAGKLHSDEQVAIKKIRHRDNEGIEQVLNEIKLLSSVSHSNLVRLLGCCIERGEQILVYEFMPNGTLSEHLQRERGTGLPWTIRLTIAVDTAKAIAHLHSAMNPPIYHRDIKSSNILLDYNFNSKVADFGLSRMGMTESSHISTAPQGTPGYVDPQYHQNFHLSDKSDVYSFGVVLVEIITALKVVDFSRVQSEVNLAALAIDKIGKGCLDDIIDPFLEPHQDAWTLSSIHKVAELAFRCLAFHRDMRPSMMEVAAELEQIRLSGWAQMEDDIFLVGSSASSCSTLSNGSENSRATAKKASIGSRRLLVPQRSECTVLMEEVNGCSPVSVQDPWFSEQSSPSSNSLLGNVVQ